MASLREDSERIARNAKEKALQLRRQIGRLWRRHLPYQRVFRPGGKYSESAIEVLGDIAEQGFIARPTYDDDARRHAFNEGKRALALHIFGRLQLDTERLASLTRQLKETGDE